MMFQKRAFIILIGVLGTSRQFFTIAYLMQLASLEFWRIYIMGNELLVFNAMSSPALDHHFMALNTADISRVLHTNHIVCVYCMQ